MKRKNHHKGRVRKTIFGDTIPNYFTREVEAKMYYGEDAFCANLPEMLHNMRFERHNAHLSLIRKVMLYKYVYTVDIAPNGVPIRCNYGRTFTEPLHKATERSYNNKLHIIRKKERRLRKIDYRDLDDALSEYRKRNFAVEPLSISLLFNNSRYARILKKRMGYDIK